MDKAYHNIEKRIMSVSEYKNYLRKNYHWNSTHNISCPECGDPIHYVEGNIMTSHFRHDPSKTGHNYCSLYTQGTESNTPESKLRKKLFEEADISLNYEIQYKNSKFNSFLTIPSFSEDDLNSHTNNKTCLEITSSLSRNKIIYHINYKYFNIGEIKRVSLIGFPSKTCIRVKGKDCSDVISYTYKCFNPYTQIYSYTIKQNYAHNVDSNTIDLSSVSVLLFKKTLGKIYTGRHYIIFDANGLSNIFNLNNEEVSIKKIVLEKDINFRYDVYDICFKKVNDKTIKFCAKRDCELLQKDDVVVLWPPLVSIGEYKYFLSGNQLFLSSESDNKSYEIKSFDIRNCVFKSISIANLNAQRFYITKGNNEEINLNLQQAKIEYSEILNKELMNSTYLFYDDVLIKRTVDEIKLKKKNHLIQFKDRLNIVKVCKLKTEFFDNQNVIDAIRYGNDYVNFNDKYYEILAKEYANNSLIMEYIDMCKTYRVIKREILDLLMGE